MANEILENTIGRYGNERGSGVDLRSRMELHKLITKPPFAGKWIPNTRRWHKPKGRYQQLDAQNAPKRRAPTVNVVQDLFSLEHEH